jgi:hypothetical protein
VLRQAVPTIAALVVIGAFFLPWMGGGQELRFHSFSGFDFARLIRNFEITAGSQSESGQIRATALLIYLMPALAANAAIRNLIESPGRIPARAVAAARVTAGVYGLAVLGALLFLSVVQVNDFADVVGNPRYGFAVSAGGCAVLLGLGVARLPSHRRSARY